MHHSCSFGMWIFSILFLGTILILSTGIAGPVAPVISQAHLICALLVGMTYFASRAKLQRHAESSAGTNPSFGRALILTGLSFVVLIIVNSLIGQVPGRDAAPSIGLQAGAIALIFGAAVACQAVAAKFSGQIVGLFGTRSVSATEEAL